VSRLLSFLPYYFLRHMSCDARCAMHAEQCKIRLERENTDPVVSHRSKNTTGKAKCRSSRISSLEKYDWKDEMPIQSYLIARKIRLERQNADPVVSPPEKSTTGKTKCRSSRISARKKYDWKDKMPIQSYLFQESSLVREKVL